MRRVADPGVTDAATPTGTREERVLKHDRKARVVVVDRGEGPVLEKTYATLPHVVWRTFGQRPKARREHDNLAALVAAGVPCVRPSDWSASTRLGCTIRSTVVMEWIDGARDLLWHLKRPPGREPIPRRRARIGEYGRLVRTLHERGFVSSTCSPRNVLVRDVAGEERLLLCDQPQLLRVGRPLAGTRLASIDLFDAVFAPRRRRLLSRAERLRFLRAYADGDRAIARKLWRTLDGRSRATNQAGKRWCHARSRVPFLRGRAGAR
ncbi:MAG: lipopolysaccharide kinase InaA family protein [Planctomycetota bacterium JB042]